MAPIARRTEHVPRPRGPQPTATSATTSTDEAPAMDPSFCHLGEDCPVCQYLRELGLRRAADGAWS